MAAAAQGRRLRRAGLRRSRRLARPAQPAGRPGCASELEADPAAGPGPGAVHRLRAGADRHRGLLQPVQLERVRAADRVRRPAQLLAGALRPGVPPAIQHNLIIAVLSVAIQLPLSIGLALLLNRQMRGRAFLRTLACSRRTCCSEATTAVIWLLMLQPGGFVDQVLKRSASATSSSLWLANLYHRALHPVRGAHLEVHRLRHHLAAGRPAGHPGGAARGGRHRRGSRPGRPPGASRCRCSAPTIRIWIFLTIIGSLQLFDHRVDHDRRRPGERVEHHGRPT